MNLKTFIWACIAFAIAGCGDNQPSKAPSSPVIVDKPVILDSDGEVDPCASPLAQRGGELSTWAGPFPKSLNMWLDYNSFSAQISSLMFESLVNLHSTQNKPVGSLAEKWEISDDGQTFTFHLHPKAMWSDGQAITADDVLFYYETMMNPKNLTSIFRVDLGKLETPKVIDAHTLQVTAKGSHWKNFWMAASLMALPRHAWKDMDFNQINFEFPVVSGPYALGEVNKGRSIVMRRRGDWWGQVKPYNQYKYNFDQLSYRAINDRVKVLELFKKGDLDLYPIYTAKIWAQQTDFDSIQKNWVVKQKVFNSEPKGFQGLAFNLRRPLFQDLRVREALTLLLDRDLMNDKYMFNEYAMLNSYYPDLYPQGLNPLRPQIKADEKKARELLKEAGWLAGPEGILQKDGQSFVVKMMLNSPDTRHMSLYQEHLKKVGIVLELEQVAQSTIRKRMDQHDFDMHWMAWGAGRQRDPEGMWHSSTALEESTSNIPGVQDPQIDQLIEASRSEQDGSMRDELLRKIDTRLDEIRPYALLWASPCHRLLYWNRFGMPKNVLSKYGDPDSAVVYWWADAQKAKALENAKSKNTSLPASSAEIHWQE